MPHKVKHTLWRASNEAIPTLNNLLRRNVVNSVYRPNCKAAFEDTIRALWGCLIVIWEADEELKKFLRYKFHTFADFLESVFFYTGSD